MAVYAITQARMGSSRLSGKVLKPILDRPLISYQLARLTKVSQLDDIIVACADTEYDQALHEYLSLQKQRFFIGHADDVLGRFYSISQTSHWQGDDIVLRLTADCPLICPEIINDMLSSYQSGSLDYYRLDTDHFARGFDAEIFRVWMLEQAHKEATSAFEREHVTPYFYQKDASFHQAVYRGDYPPSRQFRLCVDEAADFDLITRIIEQHPDDWLDLDYQRLIQFLTQHPEVAQINKGVKQRHISN